MEPARDDLPPLDGADAMLSALLDQDPVARRSQLSALRDSDPAQADQLAGMLAALDEFGLLSEPAAAPAHPTRIGRFRIVAVLGHGGMGAVYLAEQDGLNRRVALKVIHGAMAQSERMRERFHREAIAASRLEHPAICPVYEIGETDGTPWIAMRFVAGSTLGKRLEQAQANGAPLALPEAVRLVATLADGVHAAHERGLVHRDIKPGNILLDGDGKPVLVDFGLASLDDEDGARLTRTGDFVGTPHYMAPEQIGGRAVDRRCDVYALGVVLYECLTLRAPFDAVNRESLFRQILRDEPEDPRRHNRRLDRDAVTVLQTALAKDPEQRYRTAAMLADDLRRLLANRPILARRAGPLLRLRRFAQRNPLAAGFVAFLLVALGAFVVLLRDNSLALARASANEQALRANEHGILAPRAGLQRAWDAVQQHANVDTESALYHAVERSRVAAILQHQGAVFRAVYSPQGDRILTCSDDHTARLWDRSGRLVRVLVHTGHVNWAEYSPDGTHIATASIQGRVRIYNHDGELLHVLSHGRPERPGNAFLDVGVGHETVRAHFSPSGRHLASSCSDGTVRIWDVATGQLVGTLVGADKFVKPVAWSPDGSLIAAAESDADAAVERGPYRTFVWQWGSGGVTPIRTFPMPRSINTMEFAPDGASVLVSSRDGTARVFDVQRNVERLSLRHALNVPVAHFSRDGTQILTSCCDHHVRLWDLQGRVEREVRCEVHPRADWLSDGRIVVANYEPGIVVLDRELRVQHTFRGHSDMIYQPPQLSPDGRQLVSASWDHTAIVWDLHAPHMPRLPVHSHFVTAMAELADGRIASVAEDSTLCLTDLATGGSQRVPIPAAPIGVEALADGKRLLLVHNGFHGNAEAWLADARTGVQLANYPIGGVEVAATMLPDDRLVTVSYAFGDAAPQLRSLDGSGQTAWGPTIGGRGYVLAASAPRGLVAAAGYFRRIFVRNLAGEPVGQWTAHDSWVYALRFDRAGQRLASGSRDGTARIWDLSRWRGGEADETPPMRELRGHEGRVNAVAWSEDGHLLAASSTDGTVRLWHADTAEPIVVLRVLAGSVLFTRDGRFLLTGGADGVIQAWPTESAQLHELAKRALGAAQPAPIDEPVTVMTLIKELVNRDPAVVARVARELCDQAARDVDAELYDCVAWRLLGAAPGPHWDLALALHAAQEAVRVSDGRYWSALDTLAAVHFARGEVPDAVAAMRRAVALADHDSLRAKLAKYEGAVRQAK